MTFTLEHLPFTNGWRYKITDGDRLDELDTPFVLEPGEKEEIHRLDLEGEDVFGGWFLAALVTADSDDIAVQAITDSPGPENQQRSGAITAKSLINAGATEPRSSQPWAEQTTVGGSDLFTIWFNGFDGFGAPVRFPEFSRVEVSNEGSSNITVSAFRSTSILIHSPELFFRQLAAFQAAQGLIEPERVSQLDDETLEELVNIMSEKA